MLGWTDDRLLADVLPKKEATALTKAFGYTTCQDLLEHTPRAWSRHGSGVLAEDAQEGDMITCVGEIMGVRHFNTRDGKGVIRVAINDGRTVFTASFFNSSYVGRVLREGSRAMFAGKLKFYRGEPQLQHPDFLILPRPGERAAGSASLKTLSLYGDPDELLRGLDHVPIYPATSRVASWRIMAAIRHILTTLPPVPEPLGEVPAGLISFDEAVRGIHFPGPEGPEPHLERLKYNEALTLGLVMALRRLETLRRHAPALAPVAEGHRARLLGDLPYELTAGQRTVIGEIAGDLSQGEPMSRLLQGEVGSGKTVVSLVAMLQAVDAGRQCAMLAPTEVLAVQHARTLTALLADAGVPVSVVPLTGSMPVAVKRQALLDIVSGQADIVVGTHAIIEDTVEFFDLGLVVVDEQHRFGVEQRARLRAKGREGQTPHLLVMTATPIPRTIAMTVFGDLEVSTLRELPGGRKPITSYVIPESKPDGIRWAINRIGREVEAGRQAYVVCPRIDGDGGVHQVYELLGHGPFRHFVVGYLHGRMSSEDKDHIMGRFAAGEIQILVATTVIEVGVDVPNATVMLIREAENFGVSQLHQLRGRVGRGGHASTCIFHTLHDNDGRIAGVAATTDGFQLAELDLIHRQEGDVLGTSQSGTARTVKLLNLIEDYALIERATHDATELVARHPLLAQRVVLEIDRTDREFLEKS
ncbi:ATP-dependent DNA helicase RecG [Corynebacterium hylobatis]|uniref:ATP-dependent DNA helicase RecG n=1 Tax=Corynebacterium hylobatis TaxID=1859290 RepID=A0A430I273_9CORY|nr:ATP-dependent DNA helicase RecG [Corynebacterium hylobatis]RSZ66068.1 ATP-dependent DNA helicase RecG [Corynebacterium hylobatis]